MMTCNNRDDILRCLLDCGWLDLSVLDNVKYDLCEIIERLQAEGIPISLNLITDEIFRQGQEELKDAIKDAIEEKENEQFETDGSEEGETEYDRLQEEIDELESLNPEEDMEWYCNCIDTSCWFSKNEEIYEKYLPHAIEQVEDNMGFHF